MLTVYLCRSQWSHSQKSGSAAARLLGLWFLILPGLCHLLSRLCFVRSLRRADPSSRGVLSSVYVCVCVCVCVCVSLSVIRCNINPLHLEWLNRKSQSKKGRLFIDRTWIELSYIWIACPLFQELRKIKVNCRMPSQKLWKWHRLKETPSRWAERFETCRALYNKTKKKKKKICYLRPAFLELQT
jgi:hypothetical protein